MKFNKSVLCLCLFYITEGMLPILGTDGSSSDREAKVMAALEVADNSSMNELSFEMMEITGDRIRVLFHDPSRPENDRMSLLSVNSKEPTKEELETFREEMNAARASREKNSEDSADNEGEENGEERSVSINKLTKMVLPGSLKLIEMKEGLEIYSFIPLMEVTGDTDNPQKYFQGKLTYVNTSPRPYVQTIEIINKTVFKPAFGVKVKKFSMIMEFGIVLDDRIVMTGLTSEVEAKAFMVKTIKEKTRAVYRNFSRPEESQNDDS